MKFTFATLHITNMDKSIGFYNGLLGLEVLRRTKTNDGELAFLGVEGQPNLELVFSPRNVGDMAGFSIGIEVESLEEATQMMEENGYPLKSGPISPAPGVTFSFFTGPDGEEIELIQQ